MFGGLASGVRLNDLWSYDDGTWTEEIPNGALGSPAIRAEMSMAYDENLGCMLMYGGGVGGGDQLADTWKLCTDQTDDFYTILHTFGLND